jgi:HK97 family phage portal protein
VNPISRARDWLRTRRTRAELRAIGGGFVPAGPVVSGVYVTPETALALTSVYAAINVISTDIASMPRNVLRKLPGGGREVDESHPVQPLISTTPNDELDGFRYTQASMNHVLSRGNGYTEIVRDKSTGTPLDLHILHPTKTQPKFGENGRLYYELTDGATGTSGHPPRLAADDVIHLAGMGFNGLIGYSPITVARQTIGLSIAAEQFGASFFGNGAIAKGFIKLARKLSEQALNNLRGSYNRVHQGSQNANQVGILEEGADWVNTQVAPDDAQFLETRKFQVVDVARLFRLPPHKIGDYSESHLANVEEANLDYVCTTLLGWVCMIEAQWNRKLLTRLDRLTHEIRIDMSALLRGNTAARMVRWQGLRNMGAVNADEIRLGEGMNPLPAGKGGDLYLVQGQYIPLDQVGKQPLMAPSPGRPESKDFEPRFHLNGGANGHHAP